MNCSHSSHSGVGKDITLVTLDIFGSADLWGWDERAMQLARETYDTILHTTMAKFFGYEVSTDGDSSLIAFHEASDAVAWCLQTQQVES